MAEPPAGSGPVNEPVPSQTMLRGHVEETAPLDPEGKSLNDVYKPDQRVDSEKDPFVPDQGEDVEKDTKTKPDKTDPAKDKADKHDTDTNPKQGGQSCALPKSNAKKKLSAKSAGAGLPKRKGKSQQPTPAKTAKSTPKKAGVSTKAQKPQNNTNKTENKPSGPKKEVQKPTEQKPPSPPPKKQSDPSPIEWGFGDPNKLAEQVVTRNPDGGISILGPGDTMRGEFAKYKDPDGMFPVATHASPTDFHMYYGLHTGRKEYNVDTMAKIIKKNAPPGSKIRLLGCESGMTNGGVAQQLADRLGPQYQLYAPNGYCELKNGVTNIYLKKPSEMPWGVDPPKGQFLEVKPRTPGH